MLFDFKTANILIALNALFIRSVSGYYEDKGDNGAVASESRVCSQIGIDLLKRGGNAADALVGTVLCVGVIGMYHSGYVL
jgi:gamma-glutamyltranspeptidase/glutathione hydrolase